MWFLEVQTLNRLPHIHVWMKTLHVASCQSMNCKCYPFVNSHTPRCRPTSSCIRAYFETLVQYSIVHIAEGSGKSKLNSGETTTIECTNAKTSYDIQISIKTKLKGCDINVITSRVWCVSVELSDYWVAVCNTLYTICDPEPQTTCKFYLWSIPHLSQFICFSFKMVYCLYPYNIQKRICKLLEFWESLTLNTTVILACNAKWYLPTLQAFCDTQSHMNNKHVIYLEIIEYSTDNQYKQIQDVY